MHVHVQTMLEVLANLAMLLDFRDTEADTIIPCYSC